MKNTLAKFKIMRFPAPRDYRVTRNHLREDKLIFMGSASILFGMVTFSDIVFFFNLFNYDNDIDIKTLLGINVILLLLGFMHVRNYVKASQRLKNGEYREAIDKAHEEAIHMEARRQRLEDVQLLIDNAMKSKLMIHHDNTYTSPSSLPPSSSPYFNEDSNDDTV